MEFSLWPLWSWLFHLRQTPSRPHPSDRRPHPDDLPLFCHQSRATYHHRHRPYRTPLFCKNMIFK